MEKVFKITFIFYFIVPLDFVHILYKKPLQAISLLVYSWRFSYNGFLVSIFIRNIILDLLKSSFSSWVSASIANAVWGLFNQRSASCLFILSRFLILLTIKNILSNDRTLQELAYIRLYTKSSTMGILMCIKSRIVVLCVNILRNKNNIKEPQM